MNALRVYYQSLADRLDAESATALLIAAGLVLSKSTGHGKKLLQALLADLQGLVHLVADQGQWSGETLVAQGFRGAQPRQGRTDNDDPARSLERGNQF